MHGISGSLHCCRLFSAWVDALAPHASLLQLRSCGPPLSLPTGPPDLPRCQGRALRGVLCAERLPVQHPQRKQLPGDLHLNWPVGPGTSIPDLHSPANLWSCSAALLLCTTT